MRIHFSDIESDLLSPGNIFWIKNTGRPSLISKKGEPLNHTLIKKLDSAAQLIMMEDVELSLQAQMNEIYSRYCQEVLMRDKIQCREQIITLLREEFIENKKSQFELNILAWKLFSNFTEEDREVLAGFDSELLNRHLTVASSYVFCAFFLGYYESNYLKNLFTSTLKNLMDLGHSVHALTLKEKLEYFRMQESFNSEDFENIKQIGSAELLSKTMILERYDGSGMNHVNSREMSDLEIILVALNRTYGFKESETSINVLRDIEISDLKCEVKILRMLQRVLYKKPKAATVATIG